MYATAIGPVGKDIRNAAAISMIAIALQFVSIIMTHKK